MARLLYILSLLAILAACGILTVPAFTWVERTSQEGEIPRFPTAAERYQEAVDDARKMSRAEEPPLVVQAKALAELLNPAHAAGEPTVAKVVSMTGSVPTPAIRPKASSVKFRLLGTSYYENRPEESMALITEPSAGGGERRWVEEGTKLGHFVVQEIREGSIVLRNGEDVRELTVEHRTPRRSLVREVRPASRKVSKANRDTIEPDPNATIKVGVRRR